MKNILILAISIISVLLLTGCGKTDEEIKKGFDSKVDTALMDYSLKIYNEKQYINYKRAENEYYISLKNLKELGYDTTMFTNHDVLLTVCIHKILNITFYLMSLILPHCCRNIHTIIHTLLCMFLSKI